MEKVVMILVDGMRPDGMMECGHPFPAKLIEKSSYSLNAQTVKPSVTLPCHMSLFHSVDPGRHGTTTNTYMPQVRPIAGLCEGLTLRQCGTIGAITAGKVIEVVGTTFGEEAWEEIFRLVERVKSEKYLF